MVADSDTAMFILLGLVFISFPVCILISRCCRYNGVGVSGLNLKDANRRQGYLLQHNTAGVCD